MNEGGYRSHPEYNVITISIKGKRREGDEDYFYGTIYGRAYSSSWPLPGPTFVIRHNHVSLPFYFIDNLATLSYLIELFLLDAITYFYNDRNILQQLGMK